MSGQITQVAVPGTAVPLYVATGVDGAIWAVLGNAYVTRYFGGSFTTYDVSTPDTDVSRLGRSPESDMWAVDSGNSFSQTPLNRLIRLTLQENVPTADA